MDTEKIYQIAIDFDCDEKTLKKVELAINKLADESLVKFPDSPNTEGELIVRLAEKHIFFSQKLKMIPKNDFEIAMNKIVSKLMSNVRDLAKDNNIEEQVSQTLTNSEYNGFNAVLRNNNKHLYQYSDELTKAFELHEQIPYSNQSFINEISPIQLFIDPQNFIMLKTMTKFCDSQTVKYKGNKAITLTDEYVKYIEKTFPKQFRDDYKKFYVLR